MFGLSAESMGNPIRSAWDRLSRLPGGRAVFSKLVGRIAPYTGTIDAQVLELRPGYAKVEMKDRRAVRNHLKSIHAIALMNLAEVASGVALVYGLPDDARGILSGLSIDYLKKGRGTLTAEASFEPVTSNERREFVLEPVIRDARGDVVAKAKARWLIGPKKSVR